MLAHAQTKIDRLPAEVRERTALRYADVLAKEWPREFDLVLLGSNCFYELATPQEQAQCIASAAAALKPGGHVYVDNDHMEGDLDESWQEPGTSTGFPTSASADGTQVESTVETIWFDALRRLARFRRCTRVALQDGTVVARSYIQQKHPVSMVEVRTWLEDCGSVVEHLYGDRAGHPYRKESPRAIFWARKS